MGDINTSDCSWKKIVLAKSNSQWISTIKTEPKETSSTNDVTNYSSEEEPSFSNVKTKNEMQNCERLFVPEEHLEISLESDPLLIEPEQPSRRSRRKSSGPKNESPDERAVRLARMSAYAAQRLANETPEQRAVRLKRMSEYAAKRLAQETSEQRAKRLARMSAYAAKRLASETPEQRSLRLARMNAYAARRQALKKEGSANSRHSSDPESTDFSMMNMLPDQS